MPRKTDGIEFEIHPRPTKGEDGKPLLYVRPAKGRKKSFKDFGSILQQISRPAHRRVAAGDGCGDGGCRALALLRLSHRDTPWLVCSEVETYGRAHRPQNHSRPRREVCRHRVHPLQGVCQGRRSEPRRLSQEPGASGQQPDARPAGDERGPASQYATGLHHHP